LPGFCPALQHDPAGIGAPCGQVTGGEEGANLVGGLGESMCSNLQACCSIFPFHLSMATVGEKTLGQSWRRIMSAAR